MIRIIAALFDDARQSILQKAMVCIACDRPEFLVKEFFLFLGGF